MLSNLPYDELLLNSWQNIPRHLRPESRRRAFRAGRYCAEYALCEKGGEDILSETTEYEAVCAFFDIYIEPLCDNLTRRFTPSERMLNDSEKAYWDHVCDESCAAVSNRIERFADPRIKHFCDGWLRFIAEERASRGLSDIVFSKRYRRSH